MGTRRCWLAALGAANGDGRIEVAWIVAPHRDRVLRVARLEGNALVEVARLAVVMNHAAGEETITGGLWVCSNHPPEIVAPSADRAGDPLESRALGPEERP